jgi:DNA-directed RNA polymerase specialized sigma24 family protein
LIRNLRRIVRAGRAEQAGDDSSLERFVSRREESAFEELMARHGPMVLGVCRRVLRDPHDADYAFQVTCLVLAHKAASIRWPQALGSWLYRIAHRTALRARAQKKCLAIHESIAGDLSAPEASTIAPGTSFGWCWMRK